MQNISLAAANLIYAISSVAAVIGGVLTVVGTIGTFWSGAVREHYSDLRISSNEVKTAYAVADAAHANERAATLDREAAALKLELHKRTQPLVARTLSVGQRQALKAVLVGYSFDVRLVWGGMDPEVIEYTNQLRDALLDCGLRVAAMEANVNVMVVSGCRLLVQIALTLVCCATH